MQPPLRRLTLVSCLSGQMVLAFPLSGDKRPGYPFIVMLWWKSAEAACSESDSVGLKNHVIHLSRLLPRQLGIRSSVDTPTRTTLRQSCHIAERCGGGSSFSRIKFGSIEREESALVLA